MARKRYVGELPELLSGYVRKQIGTMQLVSFSCNAYSLVVSEINLQSANLFVGRNGTGKSYALRCIEWLADIISEKSWHPVVYDWKATFKDAKGNELAYSFGWAERSISIEHEELSLNGKQLIKRNQKGCSVHSLITGKTEEITPPQTKLVINVRRDTKVYPEFEKLIQWAESVYSFRFGTIVPDVTDIDRKLSKLNFAPLGQSKTDYSPANLFASLKPEQRRHVRDLMQKFGYDIDVLGVAGTTNALSLNYTEKGIPGIYDIAVMSQGTYRILILLLYFFQLLNAKNLQLLLIDDLGEGLDYSRAYKLGKFIFDACQEANVQLIATSNDSFLMDAVPIDYWNVLRRKGSEITALNEKNHPELFKQFAYTGLSNFDFFSSDYIDSKLK